ncbi:MAG: Zn-dependent hydrolase [Cyanobacteria bacterium P01_F01_bin.150]
MERQVLQTSTLIHHLKINSHRLNQSIAEFADIGALPEGGLQRLAFSDEDIKARDVIRCRMMTAGMDVSVDAAGNLIGSYPGYHSDAPALATGSHVDSVPIGGVYDGTYGVLAALEAVQTLSEHDIRLAHPVEVIVFVDEENTMIGSKAMSGQALLDVDLSADGDEIKANLERIGGNWDRLLTAQRNTHDFAAFIELHIEQGPVLEAVGDPIGLVTGIVGQRRYLITIDGRASHAGTTPMSMRQDALVAASHVSLAINQIGKAKDEIMGGEQVATVGSLKLEPNVANTIPGRVEMMVDMRDLSNDCLDRMFEMLEAALDKISTTTQTQIQVHPKFRNEPAPVNSHIHHTISTVCGDLGLNAYPLPSRASHDAQNLSRITDMGMIFVPSQAGLSHTASEYTSPKHCAQGANVLLHTLIQLDQHYRCRLEQP